MQLEASGHGYSAGREIKGLSDLLDKTGNIKFVAAEAAQNALTTAQEFHWGDVFMRFNYQNKKGKLLANGRSIEDINDVNEIGGDRMGRVMDALNQMVADRNIDEAIVVSEDLGYGRHFIYRYRRGADENIEGLAFEYQGTADELGQVVSQLGRRAINQSGDYANDSVDFSRPLFFTNENKNDVSDLSQAASNSFKSPKRRQQMDSYLNRLKRDTDGYEELEHRRYQQEKELQNKYEKLILKNENAKTGIASAVYGMIKATERMVFSEDRRREKPIMLDPGKQISEDYARETGDIIRSLSYGLAQDIHSTEQIVHQIIEPVVGGIVGLLPNSPAFEDAVIIDDEPKDDEMIWQEFISIIFQPMDNKLRRTNTPDDSKDRLMVSVGSGTSKDVGGPNKSQKPSPTERLTVSKSGFQQGLERVAEQISVNESPRFDIGLPKEESERQKIVEEEAVKLGEEIVGIIFAGENRLQESSLLAQLSFLINAYKDKDSKDVVKHLISALIYRQIEMICNDKNMTKVYPQLEKIASKFQLFLPYADFLQDRYHLLLMVCQKVLPIGGKETINKVIFIIFKLVQIDFKSFEKLTNLSGQGIYNTVMVQQYNRRKTQIQSVKNGIIFMRVYLQQDKSQQYLSGAVYI